ncbi:MAG: hypothetical protein ACPF8S_04340 [Schleiferiaceae bacterium]
MKRFMIVCTMFALCPGALAQDNFSFWKKDRAYAENAFSINTAGPIPSVGFQFDRQLSKKTTLSVFYGEANPVDDIEFEEGGVTYSGIFADESSWSGMIISYRPIEALQAFRVSAGLGVGSLNGFLDDSDGNSYHWADGGAFTFTGIGYGLRPVKGLRLGVDIGIIKTKGGIVSTNELTMDASARAFDLQRDFAGGWYPNLQFTAGWGF